MKTSSFVMSIARRFWMFTCLIVVSLTSVIFTCAPAIVVHKEVVLPPAYELKAQHPFADTATLTIPEHAGERSHGAKLTPRLVGSILLYVGTALTYHPYMPATLFGLFFLLSGIYIGYHITGERLVGLFLGMTFSGLYASSACFSINWMPKPFDGIVIGLLGLTLISIQRQWVLASMSFLSCWADERAVLSLIFIACFVIAWPALGSRAKFSRCLTIAGSVFVYLITRILLSYLLRWEGPDMSMIAIDARLALMFSPLAVWSCFEGGWITIIFAAWVLCTQHDYAHLFLLLGSVVLALLCCHLVLDISRVSSFAFPLIPLSYALLKGKDFSPRELRMLAGAGAAISLLAPNFEIVAGSAVKWLPPLLPLLLSMK